jgi:hypothetical protein
MEAQRQRMQMAKDFERQVADRPLRHRREHAVADLAQRLCHHPRCAVGHEQRDRHGDGLGRTAQGIDGMLVEDRDIDGDDLGEHQERHGNEDAGTQAPFTLRP